MLFQVGHPPLCVTFSVSPSVHLSVVHLIAGTVHDLIIIVGEHVENDDISRIFFSCFLILIFWAVRGVKGQEIAHNYQFQSVTLYISRTVDHIKILGTQM